MQAVLVPVLVTYLNIEKMEEMSETYQGKCASKNWRWKPTRSENLPDGLKIGQTFAYVETKCSAGFSISSEVPLHIVLNVEGSRHEFRTKPSDSKKECISRYAALKAYIESVYSEADKAVIGTKKSSSQTQVMKCGST